MSSISSYNPQSTDAMFATIINEVKQIREIQHETLAICQRNETRVRALEEAAIASKGKVIGAVAVLSLLAGALGGAIKSGLTKFFATIS